MFLHETSFDIRAGRWRRARCSTTRKEPNARRAAQLYLDYMNWSEDNVSWCGIAARDRFLLISGHQDQFSRETLLEAAAKWEIGERAFAREFGADARYINTGREIGRVLLDKDTALSFTYASKASRQPGF